MPLAALVFALAFTSPAASKAAEANPLTTYAQARAASSSGAVEQASAGFAAALAAEPDNELVASQALGHAVPAGDWSLALAAVRQLERLGEMRPEHRFLLVADAFRGKDWKRARQQIDLIEQERLFGFSVPVLRSWLAFGTRRGDPLTFLPVEGLDGVASSYAAQHRVLVDLAKGRNLDVQQILTGLASAGPRAARLRVAAAAALAENRKRDTALALLQGDDPVFVAARALLERNRLRSAIDSPAAGMAELLVRLSIDLHSQDLTPLALNFARIATWLAPEKSESWLVAAELMGEIGRYSEAVVLLDQVQASDPFAVQARNQKVRMLVSADETDVALARATAAAEAPEASAADWVRLGEVRMEAGLHAEAAKAFEQAILASKEAPASLQPWALWLLRGSAHDEAGQWPEALAALEEAYRLAPDQPLVLNYLGYSQLEQRQNLDEAERLIREAHRRAPDNAAITDSLGWALFLKGDVDGAIPLLEQASRGEPGDVEINEHLGDAYFTAGRRIEARFAWKAAAVYAEGEDSKRLEAKIRSGLTPQLAAR